VSTYTIGILTLIAIYSMLSVSLSLVIGHTGIFSMATAGIFGVGAYTSAILTVEEHWAFIPAMLVAIVAGVIVSAVAAVPTIRVSGDYFIVASLALQIVIVDLIGNFGSYTGGSVGLAGVLRPTIGSLRFQGPTSFFFLTLVVAVIAVVICAVAAHSPFGRVLRSLSDDEVASASLGNRVVLPKLTVVLLNGGVAAAAGVLYAAYIQFLSTSSFSLDLSVVVVSMVVIGGERSVIGCIIGAALVVLLPQWLQDLNISSTLAGPTEQAIFGALLVAIVFFRPSGLVPPGLVTRLRAGMAERGRP
jgi:branched-chain amino acid transport system permease protein